MSQNPEYNTRARISILIAVAFVLLCGLSLAVPEFGQALWQTVYCSFANVTCVSIVP
jgi:hypothetical protein